MRTRDILLCCMLSTTLLATRTMKLSADEATAAVSPPAVRPMLYEIDTQPKLYVLGTIHARDKRLLHFPPVVRRVLEDADALYTELALEEASPAKIARRLFLPEGQSLGGLLTPELLARVHAAFKRFDMPFEPVERLKLWALWLQVQGMDAPKGGVADASMDVALFREAKVKGKTVGGLETLEEQVAVFDALTPDQQLTLLVQALDALDRRAQEAANPVEGLIEAYLRGSPRAVQRAMFEHIDRDDPFQRWLYKERLIDERNVRMVRRMLERAQSHPEKTTVVAVGAAHLAGPKGILALLRGTGFRVRKISGVADLSAPWPLRVQRAPVKPTRRYRRFGPLCIPVGCYPPVRRVSR